MNYDLLLELVKRAQAGEKGAFEEIYRETYNRIYFYSFKMFGNEHDACDVVQEVFVKVFTKLDQLREPEAFMSWLYSITVNECRNKVRRDSKEILVEESQEFFENLLLSDDDPATELQQRDIKSYMMRVIDLLPEEQKRVILLYFYEKLTLAQIAEIEATSIGTIKSRLYLAKNKIRKAVDAEQRRSGIRMYALGAPAIAVILAEGAAVCAMPAAAAAKVLATALASIGFVSDDAFTYITSNETDESVRSKKNIFERLNEGHIIEIKPLKVAIIGITSLVIIAGASIYFSNIDIFNSQEGINISDKGLSSNSLVLDMVDSSAEGDSVLPYTVDNSTIDINGLNKGFFLSRESLPAEIRDKVSYYGMSFWMRNLKNVTPEVALVRNYLIEASSGASPDFFPMEDEIWVDWYSRETNIICFYDKNCNLIAYIYGYYASQNALSTDLKYVYNFDIDVQKTKEAALRNIDSFFNAAKELPEKYFYRFPSVKYPGKYCIDLDFKAAGINPGDVAYYSNILTETTDRAKNTSYLKTTIAKYWNGADGYFNEDIYERGEGYALGYEIGGSTSTPDGPRVSNCFFIFDGDGNPKYYAFLTLKNLKTLDKRIDRA